MLELIEKFEGLCKKNKFNYYVVKRFNSRLCSSSIISGGARLFKLW